MTESHVPAVAGAEPARDLATPATVATGPAQARSSAQKPAGRGADVPAIELVDVVKVFHARGEEITAVRGLDLAIREGEFFSLLGPSGCGKTTTMRMIAGFEEPTRGGIRLHGADVTGIPPNKRDVNMVFQSYALFPHMTVFENVAFGLRRKKAGKEEIKRRVGEMLEIVDLGGRGERRPRELSGGQQQRVALARALVNRPRALLLDEPLGALDLKLRQSMQIELKRIQREVGITFVFVTHDQEEALTMSDRVAVFNRGQIEQVGTPAEVYERPASPFVAGFVGTSNLLGGAAARAVIGSDGVYSIRPEKIRVTETTTPAGMSETAADGTVREVVYAGPTTRLVVTLDAGGDLVALQQNLDVSWPDVEGMRGRRLRLVWSRQHAVRLPET